MNKDSLIDIIQAVFSCIWFDWIDSYTFRIIFDG